MHLLFKYVCIIFWLRQVKEDDFTATSVSFHSNCEIVCFCGAAAVVSFMRSGPNPRIFMVSALWFLYASSLTWNRETNWQIVSFVWSEVATSCLLVEAHLLFFETFIIQVPAWKFFLLRRHCERRYFKLQVYNADSLDETNVLVVLCGMTSYPNTL